MNNYLKIKFLYLLFFLSIFLETQIVASDSNISPINFPKSYEVKSQFPRLREFNKALNKYYERLYFNYYYKVGHTKPEWNHTVKSLFKTLVQFEFMHEQVSAFQLQKIKNESKSLIDAGCLDPIIKLAYFRSLKKLGQYKEVSGNLETLFPKLMGSKYPKIFAYWCAISCAEVYNKLEDQSKSLIWMTLATQSFVEASQDESLFKGEERQLLKQWRRWGNLTKLHTLYFNTSYPQIEQINPYIYHYLTGSSYLREAWNLSRSGWTRGNVLGEADRFTEFLIKARLNLEAAYELYPDYPESASSLVEVFMLHGSIEQRLHWFARCVRAQFDFEEGYEKIFWALHPRWGGNYDLMIALARECLNSREWRTNVPMWFFYTLLSIGQDKGNWKSVFRSATTTAEIQNLFESYLRHPNPERDKNYYKANYALASYLVGDMQTARTLCDEMGEEVNQMNFPYNLSLVEVVGEIYGASSFGKNLAVVDQLILEKNYKEAKNKLKVIEESSSDYFTKLYLQKVYLNADFFQKIILNPNKRILLSENDNLGRWHLSSGKKYTKDNSKIFLTNKPDNRSNILFSLPPERNYEIQMEWEISTHRHFAAFYLSFPFLEGDFHILVGEKKALFIPWNGNSTKIHEDVELLESNQIQFVLYKDNFWFKLNDKLLFKSHPLPQSVLNKSSEESLSLGFYSRKGEFSVEGLVKSTSYQVLETPSKETLEFMASLEKTSFSQGGSYQNIETFNIPKKYKENLKQKNGTKFFLWIVLSVFCFIFWNSRRSRIQKSKLS